MSHFFRLFSEYETQISTFCCGCYWACEICEALDKKYEDG